MPFGDYEDFNACVADNSDKRDPEAYCAEIKRQIKGAKLSDAEKKALERSECPEGHVHIGGECKPVSEVVESVDAPPSILSSPQHLTLKSLDTEPIERVEESDNTVRYKSLKLLSPGVWADAGSQTATYYPPDGIANLEADYDESKHNGPPVNIMHDLDVEAWEAHEASVAGYVDPETLDTDDEGNLFGDIVFDTTKGAGQFADENLQSTLEKEGTVGFGGPSVEIPARGLQQEHDPQRDMPRVDGGLLTGVAMVMDPASKSVNFAREAARRPVALSASGESGKVLTREPEGMGSETRKKIRDEIMQRTLQVGDIQDDAQAIADELDVPIDEVMELLDPLLDVEEEEEGAEMQEEDDEDEGEGEEEDDEDTEMQEDEMGDMEALQDQVANLSSRLEDVEDALSQAMTAEDMDQELEDAVGEQLAAADSVEEVKKTLSEVKQTVEAVAEEGKDAKTLTDSDSGIDWSTVDDNGIDYDPATGSMSR